MSRLLTIFGANDTFGIKIKEIQESLSFDNFREVWIGQKENFP